MWLCGQAVISIGEILDTFAAEYQQNSSQRVKIVISRGQRALSRITQKLNELKNCDFTDLFTQIRAIDISDQIAQTRNFITIDFPDLDPSSPGSQPSEPEL